MRVPLTRTATGESTRVVLGNTSHSTGITKVQVAVTVTRKG
jgi:hypothetical protein